MNYSTDSNESLDNSLQPCLAWVQPGVTPAYHRFAQIVPGYLLTCISLVGVVGNILNLIVFSRERMRLGGLRPYLAVLSIWDLAVVCFGWGIFSLPCLIFGGNIPLYGRIIYKLFILYPLSNTTFTGCIWINLLGATERYLAICHPFLHRTLNKGRRVRLTLLAVSAWAVILNAPKWFEHEIGECVEENINELSNETSTLIQPALIQSSLFSEPKVASIYVPLYVVGIQTVFVSLGPFILLLSMNLRIVKVLHDSSIFQKRASHTNCTNNNSHSSYQQETPEVNRRHPASKQLQKRLSLTRMLVFVVIKFLICYLLTTILNVMHALMGENLLNQDSYHYMADTSNLFVIIHSSTNFLVYIFCQKKFRQHIQRTLRQINSVSDDDATMKSFCKVKHMSTILRNKRCTQVLPQKQLEQLKQQGSQGAMNDVPTTSLLKSARRVSYSISEAHSSSRRGSTVTLLKHSPVKTYKSLAPVKDTLMSF